MNLRKPGRGGKDTNPVGGHFESDAGRVCPDGRSCDAQVGAQMGIKRGPVILTTQNHDPGQGRDIAQRGDANSDFGSAEKRQGIAQDQFAAAGDLILSGHHDRKVGADIVSLVPDRAMHQKFDIGVFVVKPDEAGRQPVFRKAHRAGDRHGAGLVCDQYRLGGLIDQ